MPLTIAWRHEEAHEHAGTISPSVTSAKSMSFAQRTGSRFGTAVNVERIEPVEYSA